jgi:hypothetical protein
MEPNDSDLKIGHPKYEFYIFPKDIQDRMKNGETIDSNSVKQHKVNEKDIPKRDDCICFVSGHGSMTCACVRPDGSHFTGHGSTDIYSCYNHGNEEYCYTRYESCYIVCQRGT